ncbi:MAG: helix-turn-helix domain-containing protein [Alphaproteobacteria bacterium]|nr:helix-turn-helix domain-containing protein [Alphaproteobacteria bacterium]
MDGSFAKKATRRAPERGFGLRARRARERAGLDRTTCAARLGLSADRLAQRERGRVPFAAAELVLLADTLGIETSDFFEKIEGAADPLAAEIDEALDAFASLRDERDRMRALNAARALASTPE